MADYNGWANYETWLVKLWLDNDGVNLREFITRDRNPYNVGQATREMVEEFAPELPPSMYADLLNASMSAVDWSEIGQAVLDDNEETEQ